MEAHVSEKKRRIVAELRELIRRHSIIGVVNMENLPAPQLQGLREKLRGRVDIRMTKRRLMRIAINSVSDEKPGIKGLERYLIGMPALIFTEENPFNLFMTLKKSKSMAPAKAGQIAPKDIIINAGPTPFTPGPVIGELGQAGLKTGVVNGKVVIKEDKILVSKGEEIGQRAADVLTRLGVQPMELGLSLIAIFEKGSILTRDILDIDEDRFMGDVANAVSSSLNVAMEIGYVCKETITMLIGKAALHARSLGMEAKILAHELVPDILAGVETQAAFLRLEFGGS